MIIFRLLVCSFLINAMSLCSTRPAQDPMPTFQERHISFEHIKNLIPSDIIHKTNLLKQKSGLKQMLFVGTSEADFKLTIECMANEAGYSKYCCSARNAEHVILAFSKAVQAECPIIIIIDDLARMNDDQALFLHKQLSALKNKRNDICVVGWVPHNTTLKEEIAIYFSMSLELPMPTETQRKEFLTTIIDLYSNKKHVIDVDSLAKKTNKWSMTNLLSLVQNSLESIKHNNTLHGKELSSNEHFDMVYQMINEAKKATHKALLAAASISPVKPEITFTDLGGTIPQRLYSIGSRIKRNGFHPGILFHGPPGTGKSAIAEAIAADTGWNFVRCDGSSFASSYHDGSVLSFKRALQALQDNGEPTVLCIDECGALFNTPNHNSTNSQESLLGCLRTIIADCNNNKMKVPILIIATTNDLQKLDTALKSRFKTHTYKIEEPTDNDREQIIIPLMTNITNDQTLKTTHTTLIGNIVKYSKGLSIRDLKALVDEAKELAINNGSKKITDRYFLEALKTTLYAKIDDDQSEAAQLIKDIKREVIIRAASDAIGKLSPKTFVKLAALAGIKYSVEHVHKLRPFIWYNNAEKVSKLEVDALINEEKETQRKTTAKIINAAQSAEAQIKTFTHNQLLRKIKILIYEARTKNTDIKQEDLLKLIKNELDEIKTKIGGNAHRLIINQISKQYKK